MVTISTDKLVENPETKKIYGSSDDSTLKLSISLLGILEPLIVFKIGTSDQYQIISGNRRFEVAKELGISEIPISIIEEKDIDEVLSVGHNEQRRKLPSHYIKEWRAYNSLHNLSQGKKSSESIKATALRNELFNDVSKATMDRYLAVDKIAQKLSGGNEKEYRKLMAELDSSRNADGTRKIFVKRLQEKENAEKIPENYEYHSAEAIIYQQSSADMSQIKDGQVSAIVTSPPYYEMRDYKIGKEQLGHEESEDVFVERLVNHFDDCMRVLDDKGTMWVNLADYIINFAYGMVPEKFTIGMLNRGWILHDKIIWLKNNPVFNNAERAVVAHEYIYVFKKKQFVNYSFDWLKERDYRDNRFVIGVKGDKVKLRSIFDFRDGVITTSVANNAKLREYCERAGIHLTHNATFPISIPTIAILTSTQETELVCDPFNGTATTGRSALLFNRSYRGYDVSPGFIMQSEIRLDMPTEDDLEFVNIEEIENLVQIENKKIFDNMMNPSGLQIKSKKTEKASQELVLDNLIKDGFTVISSFPL